MLTIKISVSPEGCPLSYKWNISLTVSSFTPFVLSSSFVTIMLSVFLLAYCQLLFSLPCFRNKLNFVLDAINSIFEYNLKTKKMKNYLILILLFISIFSFSQSDSKNVVSVKKAKLTEVKLLSELVTDVAKDKAILIEVTGKVKGKVLVAECKSNELNYEIRTILKNVDAGSKIFVDVKGEGKDAKTKGYVFLATE